MQPSDWSEPFDIMCDASDYAVGAILGQRKDKKLHAIYYASRTFVKAQKNYHTTEKELLEILFAVDKLCCYLVGSKIIIYTYQTSLQYLLTKKDAKSMLIQWILLLQEFDMEIRVKKGTKNVVEDHMSKLSDGKQEDIPINDYFPYNRLVAFVRAEAPHYAHINDFLEKGSSGIKKEPEEATAIDKFVVLWYVDYINYLVIGVLPPNLTYQQKSDFSMTLNNTIGMTLFYLKEDSTVFITDVYLMKRSRTS